MLETEIPNDFNLTLIWSQWFSDFCNKIKETNILIENPKTKNKNESNQNPFNQKKKKIEFWDAYETTFHNLIGNVD